VDNNIDQMDNTLHCLYYLTVAKLINSFGTDIDKS